MRGSETAAGGATTRSRKHHVELPAAPESAFRLLVTPSAIRAWWGAAGGTVLQVAQTGFPADPVADDFFAGCERGWRETLASIARHAMEGGSRSGRNEGGGA